MAARAAEAGVTARVPPNASVEEVRVPLHASKAVAAARAAAVAVARVPLNASNKVAEVVVVPLPAL